MFPNDSLMVVDGSKDLNVELPCPYSLSLYIYIYLVHHRP